MKLLTILLVFIFMTEFCYSQNCEKLKNGYYCIDNTNYLWCYGSKEGTKFTCNGGTVCKCGKTQYNPCVWDFQDLPDCEKGPGDFFEEPEIPDTPVKPDEPEIPDEPDTPIEPDIPDEPIEPDEPVESEIPDEPIEPDQPEIPDEPIEPEIPEKPEEPETPNKPETPDHPHQPKNPKRKVAYYTNWSQYRFNSIDGWQCKFTPDKIDPSLVDYINYAFVVFDESYQVKGYEWNDEQMISQVVSLKSRNPKLKILMSIGGWNFNFFDSTKHLFSEMAEKQERRTIFINSAIKFARQHNLDGIDIDWEYPGNPDQGGRPVDKVSFTLLLKEMKEAIDLEHKNTGKSTLLLTIAAPAGPQNIVNLEINLFHQYLDWINIMTYDLHGSWENVTGSHTALYATDGLSVVDAVNHYLSADVPKAKIVVGLAHYGRGWTLASKNDHEMGSATIGPSKSGICTGENGYLSKYEIDALIPPENIRFDEKSKTFYGWYEDQFFSFEDKKSFKYKTDYICESNLGGTMMWSLDLDKDYENFKYINSEMDKC